MSTESKYFSQGESAARRMVTLEENPYPERELDGGPFDGEAREGNERRQEWEQGWIAETTRKLAAALPKKTGATA